MKKYDSYKDSGIEWIGEIPSHWEVKSFRHLFSFSRGLGITKCDLQDEGIPCISYGEIHSKYGFSVNPEVQKLKCVEEKYLDTTDKSLLKRGDFIFADTSEDIKGSGNFTVLDSDFTTVAGYHTIITRQLYYNCYKYLAYYFDSIEYRNQIRRTVSGVKVFSITQEVLKGTKLVLPTITEQTAIANFLDLKTSEIDEIIADKKRLLELYEEEKTAIINKAVTKGINPDAPMKDSGIEWLGEIPEHWEVKKIKHLLKKKKGALKTGPFGSQLKNSDLDSSGEFKVYTQRNVLDNDFIVGDDKINEVKFQTLKEFLIEEGDILFTSRGTIGVCNVFPADSEPGILHPCLIRIQIDRNRLNQDWIINYVNNSSLFIDNVKYESNATTIEVIYGGTLKETALPVPPIQEQQSIVQHIESECSKIDFKKARTEELIELLTEYRTALISEAVTGKIKVIED